MFHSFEDRLERGQIPHGFPDGAPVDHSIRADDEQCWHSDRRAIVGDTIGADYGAIRV